MQQGAVTTDTAYPQGVDSPGVFEKASDEAIAPGGVLIVAKNGKIISKSVGGYLTYEKLAPTRFETVFDVGELTSAIVTSTLLMKLVQEGRIDLNHRVSRFFPGFNVMGKGPITIGHLLSHYGGLPPTAPFFEMLIKENDGARCGILTSKGAKDFIITEVSRLSVKFEAGTKQVPSCLGYILLGAIVELLTGMPLEKAAHKYIFQPLGLRSSSFIDLSLLRRKGIIPITERIAPTEECQWRGKELRGEVQDDNAWAMGGIAGHAGLFTTATDALLFGEEMLSAYKGESALLSKQVVQAFWAGPTTNEAGASWRFGWDSPGRDNGLYDVGFSEKAVGINSITGCSLWIDPAKDLVAVLFTNALHPNRSNRKVRSFRSEVYKTALAAG